MAVKPLTAWKTPLMRRDSRRPERSRDAFGRSATNVPVAACECVGMLDDEQRNPDYLLGAQQQRTPISRGVDPRSAAPLLLSREKCGTDCGTNGRFWPSTWLSTRTHNPLVAGSSPAGRTPSHRQFDRPTSPGGRIRLGSHHTKGLDCWGDGRVLMFRRTHRTDPPHC